MSTWTAWDCPSLGDGLMVQVAILVKGTAGSSKEAAYDCTSDYSIISIIIPLYLKLLGILNKY